MKFKTFLNMKPIYPVTSVWILLLAGLLVLPGCNQQKQKIAPNILFILADDFGYHDMSSMGSAYYETPNLDQLAGRSMVFTDGYAACQVCSPSRASIMTGQFPARHGITDWIGAKSGEAWRRQGRFNKLLPADYVHQLDTAYVTLPEALRAAGYTTFFAGKWHLGSKGSWPQDHGFDINVGGWDAGSPHGGYFDPYNNPNLENRQPGENLSMRLARETADFMTAHVQQQPDAPFFAYLAFYAVHSPIETTSEKWQKYRDKADSLGIAERGFEMGKYLPVRQVQDNPVYAGLVEQMDDAIGMVLDKLEELGLEKNTIVIFTSDNGGVAAGDASATSNLPLRAGKGYQFEGGIREPYLISVPWMHHEGEQNSMPVTGTDFYPTLLELAGAPPRPDQHADGTSLVPLLKGETIPERALIWHYPHYGNQGGEPSSIIRRGDWKLIHYYEDGREELYNLAEDTGETNDLSATRPDKVKELQLELFGYLDGVGARFPVPDPEYDPEKEAARMENIRTERMQQLEQQRLRFLSEDFDPGNHWWGSSITTD
jgi:arylsulfatase A-like enzyme